jgi:hypothetical protein
MYRTKMDMADSAHHGIDSANLLIHGANAVDVFDVHSHITTGSTNADDVMPTRQSRYCSFAHSTGGTHDDYLHHYILTETCMVIIHSTREPTARRAHRVYLSCRHIRRGKPGGHTTTHQVAFYSDDPMLQTKQTSVGNNYTFWTAGVMTFDNTSILTEDESS